MAVDQMSFPVSAQQSAREAARRVAAGVAPGDYLGMMTVPGDVRIAPTRDRAAIEDGIKRIGGLRGDLKSRQFNLSASEAGLLKSNDPMTMAEVFKRECERQMFSNPTCKQEVKQEAAEIANALEQQGMTAVNGLHDVVDALESVAGRKTLIVISAGIPISRKTGGQPNLDHELARISRRAAAANINLYVFYMNVHFLRYFSAEYGRQNHTIFDDITMFGYGLEKFADAAGGSFAQVEVDADPFVDRVMRETSAYYLLAVPTEARDRDGKEHIIRLNVIGARGAIVQYRKSATVPSAK
jgi:VWFA-related protein